MWLQQSQNHYFNFTESKLVVSSVVESLLSPSTCTSTSTSTFHYLLSTSNTTNSVRPEKSNSTI